MARHNFSIPTINSARNLTSAEAQLADDIINHLKVVNHTT